MGKQMPTVDENKMLTMFTSARPGVCCLLDSYVEYDTERLSDHRQQRQTPSCKDDRFVSKPPHGASPSESDAYIPLTDPSEHRRNRSCRGRVRFPNGRSTTTRSLGSCADLRLRAGFTRAWRRRIRTCWLEAVGNLRVK